MENKTNLQTAETKKVGKEIVSDLKNAKYNLSKNEEISLVKRSEVTSSDIKTFDKTKCRLDVVRNSRGLITTRLIIFFWKLELIIPNISSADRLLLEEKYNLSLSKRIIENVRVRIFKGFRQDQSVWMRYEVFLAPTIIISNMFTNSEVVLIKRWIKEDENVGLEQKKFDFRIINSDEVLPNEDDIAIYEDWDE